jgi:hypothetical protein
MTGEIDVALRMAKGYWLDPWNSPYLRWRMETWSGIHADSITPKIFLRFAWEHRKDLLRYLHWAAQEGGN